MKPGAASRTAVIVCMGRAFGDRRPSGTSFSDPTAFGLLPEDAQRRVTRALADDDGDHQRASLREKVFRGYLKRQAKVMIARTIGIDSFIREALPQQLVILGAGLDGRAWRMPELANAVVFEVDHPDSQRDKVARIEKAAFATKAKAIHFVPVDFERDDLDAALDRAGHDPKVPTMWLWEGVVMYLDLPAIESTLKIIDRRSAAKSHLSVIYHAPAFILRFLIGLFVRGLGEPLRSSFEPEQMKALLAKYDFVTKTDQNMTEIARTLTTDLIEGTKRMQHLRLVNAIRR